MTQIKLFIQYSGLKSVNFCWFTLYCRPSKKMNKDEFMDKHLYLQVSASHLSAVVLQLHSVTPSFQTSRACLCSSWIFRAACPSFSASRAEEPRYLLSPLPTFSSCHCWGYKNMSNTLPQQPLFCVYILSNTHLLMLTTPVLPAFFSTWSHSSSSPRILYLITHKQDKYSKQYFDAKLTT